MKKGFWTVVTNIVRSSDVMLEVLDARFPEISRNRKLEQYAKHLNKHVILVFNKTDILSYPTLKKLKERPHSTDSVFISSKESKGINDLIKAIKTKAKKERIKVAIIGYPNTGKSTLINRLSKKGRAKTSSESGFTKGLQLVAGRSDLMLVDTPGVVPYGSRDETKLGLMSGISPQKLKEPDMVAYELLTIFKENNPKELEKYYGISADLDEEEMLIAIGKKSNMLLKKDTVDERRAAIKLLTDWHKGKIRI